VGAEGLLVTVGMAAGYLLMIVGMIFIPVWVSCLVVIVPAVGTAAIIFGLKVKETKGVVLDEIE
jgi:hypothetical protein